MAEILAVYGTMYGQTARVVERIARVLAAGGHTVTIWKGDHRPSRRSLDEFDGFLIAGSVRLGRHQKYLEDFVRRNVVRLNATPSAFVSVCGALMGSRPEGTVEARKYVDDFLERTRWHPGATIAFPGSLLYTRYGMLTRWMMKFISRRTGRPTDTSRDYDFTDWAAVDRFAGELMTLFSRVHRAAVPLEPGERPGRLVKTAGVVAE